jgi:hypothetical protein
MELTFEGNTATEAQRHILILDPLSAVRIMKLEVPINFLVIYSLILYHVCMHIRAHNDIMDCMMYNVFYACDSPSLFSIALSLLPVIHI